MSECLMAEDSSQYGVKDNCILPALDVRRCDHLDSFLCRLFDPIMQTLYKRVVPVAAYAKAVLLHVAVCPCYHRQSERHVTAALLYLATDRACEHYPLPVISIT